ncbi:hypothetical protein HSBAA_06520 [Vreelandella sulfidaeris]|uniref:HMA domain-containing protein n=1 Tax=Vreelandella sulfidaeris TaxID=115553 RepID=A0A455U0E8_9GAMM|nr:hypothetical protein HSBAA_06520 [Halomonas sulfidaeris]
MTCASCVKSVQKALERTEGVDTASVNFGSHSAQVFGSAEPQALIAAVEAVGYGAEPIVDMREAERTRAEQDAKTYQRRAARQRNFAGTGNSADVEHVLFHPSPDGAGSPLLVSYWPAHPGHSSLPGAPLFR